MIRRVARGFAVATLTALFIAACGGPPTAPPPPPPPVNNPPVIQSVTVQRERVEVNEEVVVTATVSDLETPVDQLKFDWSGDAGSFTGQGAVVRWQPPTGVATPADYTLRLMVTETFGTPNQQGVRPQHVVTASSPVIRVHNSPRELGDMSIRFLTDFANSSVPASVAVREFSDSCRGKFEELEQIEENRQKYQILSSNLRLRSVTVTSGGMNASSRVECEFVSRIKVCPVNEPACRPGMTERVSGDCDLTSVYEQRRWWLCTSNFNNAVLHPFMRAFFGSR